MQNLVKILIVVMALSGSGLVNAGDDHRHRQRVVKRVQASMKIRKSKPQKIIFRFDPSRLNPRGQARAAFDALRDKQSGR